MRNADLREHLTIAAQLPDYVLGKLDETSLRRVARHLDVCPTCRRESANAMNVLGLLADVPPPSARVRSAILARAAAELPAAIRRESAPRLASIEPAAARQDSQPLVPVPDRTQRAPFGKPVPRWALVAASLAVFLVSGLTGLRYEQRLAAQDDRITALVNDPGTAYPLDDSDLPVPAAGVVFAEPQGRELYLVANGLPVLPRDKRYQVWLFTTENTQESAGLLTVEADGDVSALLQTPDPFADYVGVGLTAEPQAGSTAPTSDLVLGGSFPPVSAALLAPPS
jgi:hypothetical protein